MKLVLKNLDFKECLNYLELEYSSGLSFSQRITQESYLKMGRFYTIVPDNVKEEDLYKFQWGGLIYPFYRSPDVTIMPVRNDSKVIIDSSLIEYVNQSNTHFIGMEDFSTDLNSPHLLNYELKYYLLQNDKLFYLLDHKNTSEEFVKYKGVAGGYLFLCMILKLPSEFTNSISNIKLDYQITDRIFQGITSFFISVYDGEGYLIWCDNEQNDFLKLIVDHLPK